MRFKSLKIMVKILTIY